MAARPLRPRGAVSRRAVLAGCAGILAAGLPEPGVAGPVDEDETERHGLSAFGDLKYPADFHHVDYVNPLAPKGGTFSWVAGSR
ncbi:MAG: ABC transporter substrate-binding protein, partial [Xanthobacteraceae bacterium]